VRTEIYRATLKRSEFCFPLTLTKLIHKEITTQFSLLGGANHCFSSLLERILRPSSLMDGAKVLLNQRLQPHSPPGTRSSSACGIQSVGCNQ
jgi:hypothetical protein